MSRTSKTLKNPLTTCSMRKKHLFLLILDSFEALSDCNIFRIRIEICPTTRLLMNFENSEWRNFR